MSGSKYPNQWDAHPRRGFFPRLYIKHCISNFVFNSNEFIVSIVVRTKIGYYPIGSIDRREGEIASYDAYKYALNSFCGWREKRLLKYKNLAQSCTHKTMFLNYTIIIIRIYCSMVETEWLNKNTINNMSKNIV